MSRTAVLEHAHEFLKRRFAGFTGNIEVMEICDSSINNSYSKKMEYPVFGSKKTRECTQLVADFFVRQKLWRNFLAYNAGELY